MQITWEGLCEMQRRVHSLYAPMEKIAFASTLMIHATMATMIGDTWEKVGYSIAHMTEYSMQR